MKSSETFRELYYDIIDEMFAEILGSNINLCLRAHSVQYELCGKFDEYCEKGRKFMVGNRLDRHKLAACVCGAITEVKPLTGVGHVKVPKTINESLGVYVGLHTVKLYMQNDLLKELASPELKQKFLTYLKSHFVMRLPSERICDTLGYIENLSNALYWHQHKCKVLKKECYLGYDILAYSTIFYHLELYNKPSIQQCYEDFRREEGLTP